MIARAAGAALDLYAGQRRRAWERIARRAPLLQARTFLGLVARARQTEFGRARGFDAIRSVADYQAWVPLGDYLAFQPLWRRAAEGEENVAWSGRPRDWVKTSGTTAGDKYIPVTLEALASHRKGGWDAFALAARQDIRLLCGMPSWTSILLERVAQARRQAGAPIRSLAGCWPNLRLFIHGGVAFPPYRRLFEERLGRPVDRVEVYPASEGFVALQTESEGGLTLTLDYDIFYEFIPVEELGTTAPRRHTVEEAEPGRPYAIVLTTPAGPWSYLLGDTVRFAARDPLRLVIIGRTRHFVNAFGENVIVEEMEQACLGGLPAGLRGDRGVHRRPPLPLPLGAARRP